MSTFDLPMASRRFWLRSALLMRYLRISCVGKVVSSTFFLVRCSILMEMLFINSSCRYSSAVIFFLFSVDFLALVGKVSFLLVVDESNVLNMWLSSWRISVAGKSMLTSLTGPGLFLSRAAALRLKNQCWMTKAHYRRI